MEEYYYDEFDEHESSGDTEEEIDDIETLHDDLIDNYVFDDPETAFVMKNVPSIIVSRWIERPERYKKKHDFRPVPSYTHYLFDTDANLEEYKIALRWCGGNVSEAADFRKYLLIYLDNQNVLISQIKNR